MRKIPHLAQFQHAFSLQKLAPRKTMLCSLYITQAAVLGIVRKAKTDPSLHLTHNQASRLSQLTLFTKRCNQGTTTLTQSAMAATFGDGWMVSISEACTTYPRITPTFVRQSNHSIQQLLLLQLKFVTTDLVTSCGHSAITY